MFENRLRFDKVTDSQKVETFFETQCTLTVFICVKLNSHLVTHLVWPHQSEIPTGEAYGLSGLVHEEGHPCFPYFA